MKPTKLKRINFTCIKEKIDWSENIILFNLTNLMSGVYANVDLPPWLFSVWMYYVPLHITNKCSY